jgi:4-hydroxyphenylpyruvate dioxygenase
VTDQDVLHRAKEMAEKDDFPLIGFSHLEWWVGNAFQTAQFLRSQLGFGIVGYRGPETGTRDTASYMLQQGDIRFIVTGAMGPEHPVADHVRRHGPGVKDVAIAVPDADSAFEVAVERGAEAAVKPHVLEDDHGRAVISAVQAYGDTIHSFVQLEGDMPGFERREDSVAVSTGLEFIDHVVANVELGKMDYWVEWYERIFGFTLLKHFDDDAISTKYTALMSKVMWDGTGIFKLPINEPAEGLRKSQIDEYLQFYGGPGVQHIAMHTRDLLETVACEPWRSPTPTTRTSGSGCPTSTSIGDESKNSNCCSIRTRAVTSFRSSARCCKTDPPSSSSSSSGAVPPGLAKVTSRRYSRRSSESRRSEATSDPDRRSRTSRWPAE